MRTHWLKRFAIVKSQHFDAMVARAIWIEPNHCPAINHLATVDIEFDPILPVTDGHGSHVLGGNGGRRPDLGDHGTAPSRLARPARSRVIMRRCHQNVLDRHLGPVGNRFT